MDLLQAYSADQRFTLADPAPWDLVELKQAVDVSDPRSVAAYWVWAVCRLTDDYDGAMAMMKYLFADLEPFGRGFTEGGVSGRAGWDTYFNERLRDPGYRWLPRAYFEGASAENGFVPGRPLTVALHYNAPNTETINGQTLTPLGRLNIVYWVESRAGGNRVNITLSRFDGSARWYVTSGASSAALFYDQRGAVSSAALALARAAQGDGSTEAEHRRRYSGMTADDIISHMIDMPSSAAPGSTGMMGAGGSEPRARSGGAASAWTCPSCARMNTENFCPSCGTKRPEAPPAPTGTWNCPSCGAECTSRFCPQCGTPRPSV